MGKITVYGYNKKKNAWERVTFNKFPKSILAEMKKMMEEQKATHKGLSTMIYGKKPQLCLYNAFIYKKTPFIYGEELSEIKINREEFLNDSKAKINAMKERISKVGEKQKKKNINTNTKAKELYNELKTYKWTGAPGYAGSICDISDFETDEMLDCLQQFIGGYIEEGDYPDCEIVEDKNESKNVCKVEAEFQDGSKLYFRILADKKWEICRVVEFGNEELGSTGLERE